MIPLHSLEKRQFGGERTRSRAEKKLCRFDSEKELVRRALLQSPWSAAVENGNVGALTELETPNGIVDIAFYQLRRDWQNHASIGDVPSRWAYAFHLLPYRRQFSAKLLTDLTGVSLKGARNVISAFFEAGLCRPAKNRDCWIKTRQPYLALRNLIAVEAKLRDWKRALRQASRYLDCADQAWVLLDAQSIRPALEAVDEFSTRNVGLASISTSGEVYSHCRPSQSTCIKAHDRWVVNSELLKHISTHSI